MLTISALLRAKGHDIYWVEKGTSILKALELMAEKGIGALLVMEGMEPVGIFSERDFARVTARNKAVDLKASVDTCMTTEIYCVSPNETIEECMALMTTRRFRHVPVKDGNKLVGIVSIGDVVKHLIEDKDLLIDNMEKYILGRGYGE